MSDDNGAGKGNSVITPRFDGAGRAPVVHGDFTSKDQVTVQIGHATVKLIRKSIFEVGAQAVIVPQWPNKLSEGGIAAMGMKKHGRAFNDAYGNFLEAKGSSENPARIVVYNDPETGLEFFHTVTVGTGHLHASRNVHDAVAIAMVQAEKRDVKSIAFPAMCTGIQGELTDEQSAKTIAKAIHTLFKDRASDIEIIIAISGYDEQPRFEAFKSVLSSEHHYVNFDPAAEVGQRAHDLRRVLHERAAQGELGVEVIGADGNVFGEEPEGVVVTLHPKVPGDTL